MFRNLRFDKLFLIVVTLLILIGLFVFTSASFGLLTRGGATFGNVAFNQLVLGLGGGIMAAIVLYKIPYRFWGKYSLYILIGALVLTAAVFIPGLGFAFGGARRWLDLGPLSFQPVELLKIAVILYLATWATSARKEMRTFFYGLMPFLIVLGITGILLILQPDHGSLVIVATTVIGMFIAAGGKTTHLATMIGALGFAGLFSILTKPYVMERITTFLNPATDPLGASYQVRQALIAIGSGTLFGRGFGQSVQKFYYLPEPIGDSIFAVFGEEFGFVGAIIIISLFLFFAWRGLHIARTVPDTFGRLVVTGIVIMIVSQAFLNMAAMLGLFPLTGIPLPFISHGGTALAVTIASIGLVLNISQQSTLVRRVRE